MKSYMVYLAKSYETVKHIQRSFSGELKTDDVEGVECHKADGDERIPPVYYGKGYYCCIATLSEYNGEDQPTYELTIC